MSHAAYPAPATTVVDLAKPDRFHSTVSYGKRYRSSTVAQGVQLYTGQDVAKPPVKRAVAFYEEKADQMGLNE